MKVAHTIAELRGSLDGIAGGSRIGLVPTMGGLHGGHLALLDAARRECEVVVASVFVNPAQFRPGEDYESYPRDPEGDERAAQGAGVDFLFVPAVAEMYPEGFQTWVDVEQLANEAEGALRPGHFRGVATVCLKLFNIVRPARAYFGQKDAQQAAVVEQLVRDLNVPVEIRLVQTVRDEDGVALSSRNAYLSAEERKAARALPRALFAGEAAYRGGRDAVSAARDVLDGEERLATEYIELARFNGRLHLAVAARAGKTRLIDNVLLEGEL